MDRASREARSCIRRTRCRLAPLQALCRCVASLRTTGGASNHSVGVNFWLGVVDRRGISNDVGRVKGLEVYVFVVSDTHVASAPRRWFLRESNDPSYFDNLYPTAWLGPVVFILVVD